MALGVRRQGVLARTEFTPLKGYSEEKYQGMRTFR